MYALEVDNPKAHLLPETMTKTEAAELAVSVCLPAKMPTDWPERQNYLSDAQRLITKANTQGAGVAPSRKPARSRLASENATWR